MATSGGEIEQCLSPVGSLSPFSLSQLNAKEEGLVFDGITKDIKKRHILLLVSGYARRGHILALMGSSGAGKTTLLNIISGYGKPSQGSVTLCGQRMNDRLRRRVSYVMQNDVFFPNLTLRETLTYSALLRLPRELCLGEKMAKVEDILKELNLKDCANTSIGSFLSRGLSGGEKKRASIAMELLTNPVMLVLDEPTSGLDSNAASKLMKYLSAVAKAENMIMVMSIHQPSSQIFHMFDDLLLLCKGQTAYFGEAANAIEFMSNLGLPCEVNYNPADFLIEILNDEEKRSVLIKEPEEIEEPLKRNSSDNIVSKKRDKDGKVGSDGIKVRRKWPTRWDWHLQVLLLRTFRQSRHVIISKYNTAQTLLLTLFVSLFWFQVPYREENIFDRYSYVYFSLLFWSINSTTLAAISIPTEHPVVSKELAAGFYHLSAYYVAKLISEIPLVLLDPSIYFIITFWVAGIGGPVAFFGCWAVLILNCLAGQSLGVMIAGLVMDFQRVVTTTVVVMVTFLAIGGFFVRHLPFWLQWAQYGVFVNYGYHAMLQFVFEHENFRCSQNVTMSIYNACNGTNATSIPGTDVLEQLSVTLPLYQNIVAILAFGIGFRILGYFPLKFLHRLKI